MPTTQSKWFKSPTLVIATIASFLVLLPFVQALLLGAVFGIAFYPLYCFCTRKTKISKSIWVYVFTGVFALLTTASLGGLVFFGTQFGIKEAKKISKSPKSSESIDEVKEMLDPDIMSQKLAPWLPMNQIDLRETIRENSKKAVAAFAGAIQSGVSNLPMIFMALVAIFGGFFTAIKYGDQIQRVVLQHSHLSKENTLEMMDYFTELSKFIIISSLASGLVQTLVMGLTCVIAGVDQIIPIMILIFFFSFVPFVGTTPVALAVIALQLFQGHSDAAIIVFVGSLIMGVSDNIIRSLFLGKFEFMPSVVAFFAILAGMITLGPIGIVTGPLILGCTWKLFALRDQAA